MFDNALIGVDGGQGGRDAIALAKLLISPWARITFAHVYPGDAYVWREARRDYHARRQDAAQQLLEAEREEATVSSAELRSICSSTVGRGLHELAAEVEADLLVVGSCRRGLMGRVLLGDDTYSALTGASCAVAIAPAGYASEPALMREVGVAYNGSAESRHAVAVARALTTERGATLSAFEAVSVPAHVLLGSPSPVSQAIEDAVNQARQRIAALGLEAHAAYGPAVEELSLYSASLDLLVVGSRDYGPIGRLVHGSTSRQLARAARCPLLVLTRGARAGAPEEDLLVADELVVERVAHEL